MWNKVRQIGHAAVGKASFGQAFVAASVFEWANRRFASRAAAAPRAAGDRGDVPGWVLITLMTAGLVVVLWAAAGSRLEALFDQAMDAVTGPGG